MKHPNPIRRALALCALVGAVPLAAYELEPAPAPRAHDPAARHATGGPAVGPGAPVVVHLRDVPTGDPEARPGLLRGHEQGARETVEQPGFLAGVPERDATATFGPAPAAAAPRPGDGAEAPGDLLRSFDGQGSSGWIPPDPVLAVGPRHIVEVVNSGFTVFSKDGGRDRNYTDLETFFAPLFPAMPIPCTAANCFVFDPRVLYTQAFNRFVLFALVRDDVNLRSYLFFAVSQTSDPLGSWWLYFSFDPVNTDTWVDYSGMSADPWGVYFTGNEFFWAGGYKHSIILSVRPDVFSGAWNGAWIFWDLRWNEAGNPLAFELQPAVPSHGFPGDQATFFVNTFNFSGDKACVWKLTGDRGSSPTLVRNSVPVQPYADPGLAHQPDPGADDIEMFYAGAQNVAYSQRKVYLALNDAGTGQSGFYVSKVDVDGLVEDRNISYYTGGFYYYYPNVMLYGLDSVNPLVALAMSYSSDADFPSGAFKVYENFMVDSSGDFWQAGAGAATYNVYFNGRNRWGDYMGVARDHSCDTVWAVTEYAPLTNVWRTRIAAMAGDQALPLSCRLIFDDGFEIGNTLNWSSVAP